MFTLRGIELVYLLHRLVEDIHSRRLQGDFSVPSVEVDAITEGRMRSVIAELETDDDWWLQAPSLVRTQSMVGGPLGGPSLLPLRRGFIVARPTQVPVPLQGL